MPDAAVGAEPPAHGTPAAPGWIAVSSALAVLYLALSFPNHPDRLTLDALTAFPLELLAIGVALAVAGVSALLAGAVRAAVTVVLCATILIKLADIGLFLSLSREFNLAYDFPLLHAGWMLLSGSRGVLLGGTYLLGAALLLVGVAWSIWWATGVLARRRLPRGALMSVALVCIVPLIAAVASPLQPLVSGATTQIMLGHWTAIRKAQGEIASLEADAKMDRFADADPGILLNALRGKDVLIAFVESYGRSSLDNPLYRATTERALGTAQQQIAGRGLVARSAWLTSPTAGGQSWLAHSTLLSGLWIDSQGRYSALTESRRKTLLKLAAESGWRTVGVMPAITMPWPEAPYFGYDRVLAAKDLDYRGLPFNWVTMPDQFTWAAFQRQELLPARRDPVFAELSLISSHAPWTPIPHLVPWGDVGDGTIFSAQAVSGDSPEVVWSDKDRVRDQFRQSIDYALRTIGEFAALNNHRPFLLVVLGDHQPADFISGTDDVRDVPIHIIGDPETISHIDSWGWSPGLIPAAEAPVWRMDGFRERFLDAFTPIDTNTRSDGPA